MRRLLFTALTAFFLLSVATFGGMAVFGMERWMQPTEACLDTSCGHTEHVPTAVDCLDHCLSRPLPATVAATPLASLIVLLALTLILRIFGTVQVRDFIPAAYRWLEDIGKALRHQSLSTIVLRN